MEYQEAYLNKLPDIVKRILTVSNPTQIILFGSYARGDFNQNSDLDLLVIMEGVTAPRAESIRLRRALRGVLVPVDIIVSTPEQLKHGAKTAGWVYHNVLNEGKVIYERPTAA